MKKYGVYGIILLALTGAWQLSAQESSSFDVDEIIEYVDRLYRAESSYAEIEMEIVTPHWQRTLEMKSWSEGLKKTFIRITAPKKEQGTATLRIGSEMWNYLPRTNKVIKIPPSMMMSSWMGSDFTNDDLVKEFSLFEDYTYERIYPDGAGRDTIFINCIPREDLPVVWGNIVIAVTASDSLPVWQKYYDEQGGLMRLWTYSDVRTFDGRTIPATMTLIPQAKEGHKTVIRYRKLEYNPEIDADIFSLRNLRSAG